MKIPITNNSKNYMTIGTMMIPPGETFHLDEQDVPPHLRPAPHVVEETIEMADPLNEMIGQSVKNVIDALPSLNIEQVEKLGDLEQAGQARKTLLSAIAEELLNRASNSDMLAKIAAMSDEDLAAAAAQEDDHVADVEVVAAIEAEIARRNAG